MKDQIGTFFKKQGLPSTVKYIDPSYMVRSVPAISADSIYCSLLAQNAVHGAMAGFTQFTVVRTLMLSCFQHTFSGRSCITLIPKGCMLGLKSVIASLA